VDEYYQFLAHSVVRNRDKKFWDYHKRKLTEAGVGFSRVRLGKAVVTRFLNLALNPKSAIERHLGSQWDAAVLDPPADHPDKQGPPAVVNVVGVRGDRS
jgi:hypothetical protein